MSSIRCLFYKCLNDEICNINTAQCTECDVSFVSEKSCNKGYHSIFIQSIWWGQRPQGCSKKRAAPHAILGIERDAEEAAQMCELMHRRKNGKLNVVAVGKWIQSLDSFMGWMAGSCSI